ncbi:MAG: S9 family peptidase [Rickettsiaceae bacterium]|nr:S9 family peptidase [Rickettsiaceae bacterium]
MVLKRLFASILILTVVINLILLYNKDRVENAIQQGNGMKKEDNLISREVLFGNPDRVATRISKDGKLLSYIAPKDGVLNIWVAPVDKISEAKVITNEKQRGIRSYFWGNDNTHIIYAQDKKGDENWRLYSVNVLNDEQKDLTPSDGVRASVLKLSDKYPNEILILINDRVPEYFDIYRVNIDTGKRELVYENSAQYSSFLADDDFKIRLGYKMLPSGEGEIYLFENGDIEKAKLFQKISTEDMLTTAPLHISSDGTKLFMSDSSGRNTSALIEVDLSINTRKVIYENDKADIDDYIVDTKSKMIQGVATNYLRKDWRIIDSKIALDLEYLKEIEDGDLEIVSRTYEDDKWVVVFSKSDSPSKYYLYDRTQRKAQFLFVSNTSQEGLPFSRMYPHSIKSRDGLDLVSYLTIPRWLDDGKGIPSKTVPLVVYVHGGPNARDSWGFSSGVQWLANRGYAVLNVNYRGSTGFGKNFSNAGDGEWARKMQDDLADGVQWAIDNKVTQKDQIVIMGGSYGGYAALVGMTMTPDMYVAGIDIVGPSNLETLLNSIPPYWKPQMAHLIKIIGASPDVEEGREFLKERSPLNFAKNIKKPLLIVQGANDPRVKQAESDQIVEAMKKLSIPVVYLLYPDEGHGLARPENRLSMYANAEVFLANFAGGRFVPHNNNFPGSSVVVKEGKEITWTREKE